MEPTSVSVALKVVTEAKKALDTAALRARVDAIDTAVDAIGRHLEENVLADVRAAFSHLEVAVTVTDARLSQDELGFARQSFNRLAERTGDDTLLGTHASLFAAHVSALGHIGNYHYFLLCDQPEHALVAAYRCTEQFPALGISLLPVELFSRDYRDELPRDRPEQILIEYRSALASHVEARRLWGLEKAWRVPAAAGALVAGLVGSTVNPSLAARGAQWATGILATTQYGFRPPTRPDKDFYLDRASHVEKQLAPVAAEALERRLMIERRMQTRQ